jgi:hypothetical protein
MDFKNGPKYFPPPKAKKYNTFSITDFNFPTLPLALCAKNNYGAMLLKLGNKLFQA